MMTDQDMRDQVNTALGFDAEDHDVKAIVDDIQAKYGTVDIDTVPSAEFWVIVSEHAK